MARKKKKAFVRIDLMLANPETQQAELLTEWKGDLDKMAKNLCRTMFLFPEIRNFILVAAKEYKRYESKNIENQ